MNDKQMPELPKPIDIPDDLYYVVRQLVDAWNEKRVISIQVKDAIPPEKEQLIQIRILNK